MKTRIAILRGINVSGHKVIKMKTLKEIFENLGFAKVRTYIQSGNVVFESDPPETGTLEIRISEAILDAVGFEVPVIVMDLSELEHVSSQNKFITDRGSEISRLHVTFLSAVPEKNLAESIMKEEYLPDEYLISGKTIYLFCPGGYGNTRLSNTFFEKKLKVQATTRNWKTVLELVKIGRDPGA
jgi:uncharacterized protein (DUF1697 family)